MTQLRLPAGLVPSGCSPTFTADSLPKALGEEHALGAGRWGVLQLLEGSASFVDLKRNVERPMTAPDTQVIAPLAPHKLRVSGPLTCRIDFFVEDGRSPDSITERRETDPVRESFARCERAGDFATTFYDTFLGASPEIAPFFVETSFEKQRKLLRATVQIMVTRHVSDLPAREVLERIGESHSRQQLNIPPRLYEVWLDSVCLTVEAMDPEWSEEVGHQWRERLRPGMQLIMAAY